LTVPELAKVYEPHEVEKRIYGRWIETHIFHANADSPKPAYTIVIPLPNITGELHMGHALNNTLQDVLTRHARMKGCEALYLPGMDHASIAVETKVTKLLQQEGKNKLDVGREEFLRRVWEWKEKYGGLIVDQQKRLGLGCDWDRFAFTMDETRSQAVREAFVRYHELGLLYKDVGMVNWCPGCRTAISDIEVKHEDTEGKLWYIKYPAANGHGYLTVATTRPETMLGDTAVAVNPRDERYKHWVGQEVELPLTGRRIPVIADDHVEMSFGTGAVKVTPAHDQDDFWMGVRHNLPRIIVIDERGHMTTEAGQAYVGLSREQCRQKVIADLKALDLLEKIEPHALAIGHCDRCNSIIEPLASMQWWLKMEPLAGPAMEVVREGKVKFVPERWSKIYLDWMENVHDWVISRQLWWGHRIPAWYCPNGHITVSRTDPNACAECGSKELVQDPDVLDTWFSSALWPMSTMGWPQRTPDLKKFFPTDVLVTAPDIIFLWVARMIFSALTFEGRIPYHTVYFNSTVQNVEGQRMSKSLGTGSDPLEIVERMGADAVRYTLMLLSSGAQSFRLSEERFDIGRNLTNKLWNAARLLLSNVALGTLDASNMAEPNPDDKWIRSRLYSCITDTDKALDNYRFNDHANGVYEFFWHEFCDWYLEMIKPRLAEGADSPGRNRALSEAIFVFDQILRLLHPIMPFITEELWQHLEERAPAQFIATAPWPTADPADYNWELESWFALIMDIVRNLRNLRANLGVPPGAIAPAIISAPTPADRDRLRDALGYITNWSRCEPTLEINAARPPKSAAGAANIYTLYLPLEGLIDFAREKARLQKDITTVNATITRLSAQMDNTGFMQNAPPEIVEEVKENLRLALARRDILSQNLAALE
jgi:valyl-tRNA synthetase